MENRIIYTVTVYTLDKKKKVCNYLEKAKAKSRADAMMEKLVVQIASKPETDAVMVIEDGTKRQIVGLCCGNPVCTAGVVLYEAPLVF